jgi:hypothetical protein
VRCYIFRSAYSRIVGRLLQRDRRAERRSDQRDWTIVQRVDDAMEILFLEEAVRAGVPPGMQQSVRGDGGTLLKCESARGNERRGEQSAESNGRSARHHLRCDGIISPAGAPSVR